MEFVDGVWGPLSLAVEASGTSAGDIVRRLNEGDLRGYQTLDGRIYVHKDEFIRLRDEKASRDRAMASARVIADAKFESPLDQAAYEKPHRLHMRGGK